MKEVEIGRKEEESIEGGFGLFFAHKYRNISLMRGT